MPTNFFANNLLLFLRDKKITQKKLAEMLKTKESVVSNWMKGKTEPSSKSIIKLSKILDIPTNFFYENKTQLRNYKNIHNSNIDNNNIINNTPNRLDLLEERFKRLELEIELLKKEIELKKKNKK